MARAFLPANLCARSLGPIVMERDCWKLVVNVNQNLLGKCFLTLSRHAESVGVIREVAEEANVQATADYLVGVYSNLSASRVIFDFLGSWISGEAKTGDETVDVCWADRKNAVEMIEHPGYSRRLRQLLEFDGRVLYQSYTSDPFEVHTERLV